MGKSSAVGALSQSEPIKLKLSYDKFLCLFMSLKSGGNFYFNILLQLLNESAYGMEWNGIKIISLFCPMKPTVKLPPICYRPACMFVYA